MEIENIFKNVPIFSIELVEQAIISNDQISY